MAESSDLDAAQAPGPPSVGRQLTSAAQTAASVLGLAGYVYLIGGIVSWVRFGAAHLPSDFAVATLGNTTLLEVGLRAVLLSAVVFAASCVLAYFAVGNWDANGPDWHYMVRHRGVAAAARELKDSNVKEGRDLRRQRTLAAAAKRRGQAARNALGAVRRNSPLSLAKHIVESRGARESPKDADLGARAAAGVVGPAPENVEHREPEDVSDPQPAGDAHPLASPSAVRDRAALGDRAVRVIAGFNNLVLSAVAGLVAVRVLESLVTYEPWVVFIVWLVAAGITDWVLVHWGPLRWGPKAHFLAWVVVAAAALFVSAPVGLLVVGAVAVSTLGRALARLRRPDSLAGLLRSPLPWALFTFYMFVALAYVATPPVSFPQVVVATANGDRVGGLLARSSGDIYLVSCTPLADATSTNERVVRIASASVKGLSVGGPTEYVDTGDRPSLGGLALSALGIDGDLPTLLRWDPRARQATCAGAEPQSLEGAREDPSLGSGVMVGPPPPDGQAHDGESPIQKTTPAAIAALARRYQPTVEVTVADRFWPVSVGAVLEDIGSNGARTCLVSGTSPACNTVTSSASLVAAGSKPSDYLRFPAALKNNPMNQFEAFERGQDISPGPPSNWLADPGVLDPWYTAQVYFFYAGPIPPAKWPARPRDPNINSKLIGLEYWFFYPFNYYPTLVNGRLMDGAPLAGDVVNTDLHQGDWEHVVVLLDPTTFKPLWLYLARHADEGTFLPWDSPTLAFDHGHPIIQAAFGGHPSYDSHCGARPRQRLYNLSSDWVVCGSGRFAFPASTTPLVDLAHTSWACWEGHFGEAKPGLEVNEPGEADNVLTKARTFVFVAGPVSPLQQAENTGVCNGPGPRAPEIAGSKKLAVLARQGSAAKSP